MYPIRYIIANFSTVIYIKWSNFKSFTYILQQKQKEIRLSRYRHKIRLSAEDMSRFFIYFVSPYVTGNH